MSSLDAVIAALSAALPRCRVSVEPQGSAIYLEFADGAQLTLSFDRRVKYALEDDPAFSIEAAAAIRDALVAFPGERTLTLSYDENDRLRVKNRY